jgi:hypothetical protein
MSNSGQSGKKIRRVYRKIQKNKSGSNRASKKPVFRIICGGLIAVSTIFLIAGANPWKKDFVPAVESGATQDKVRESKMPKLNPFVPVFGI